MLLTSYYQVPGALYDSANQDPINWVFQYGLA